MSQMNTGQSTDNVGLAAKAVTAPAKSTKIDFVNYISTHAKVCELTFENNFSLIFSLKKQCGISIQHLRLGQ